MMGERPSSPAGPPASARWHEKNQNGGPVRSSAWFGGARRSHWSSFFRFQSAFLREAFLVPSPILCLVRRIDSFGRQPHRFTVDCPSQDPGLARLGVQKNGCFTRGRDKE